MKEAAAMLDMEILLRNLLQISSGNQKVNSKASLWLAQQRKKLWLAAASRSGLDLGANSWGRPQYKAVGKYSRKWKGVGWGNHVQRLAAAYGKETEGLSNLQLLHQKAVCGWTWGWKHTKFKKMVGFSMLILHGVFVSYFLWEKFYSKVLTVGCKYVYLPKRRKSNQNDVDVSSKD